MNGSKTILITGGAGFMGSNLIKHLFHKYPNYRIMVLDALTYSGDLDNISEEILKSPRFSFWYGNVQNASLVGSLVSKSNVVIHLAAETHVTRSIFDNLIFFETDVLGTQAVANAILKNFQGVERFIHISTSEVYGTAEAPLIKEDEHPLMPLTPYASAKTGADRLVYSYWKTYEIPAIIVRPFNNYGPHQHLEKVIPRFITSCILNEALTIHGDGSARRDWLYVKDFCRAIDAVIHCDLDKVIGQVLNIGTQVDTSIKEIAELITDRMHKPKSLITYIDDRPGQVFRHTASAEKMKRLLSWEAEVKFEQGLEQTIKWYENNRHWWKKRMWMKEVPIITKEGKTIIH